METRFGHDFSAVRVRADTRAAASAQAEGARAYTLGREIVFGEGRYAPETREGKRLLAHELAHVVQQSRPGRTPAAPAVAEGEAESAGEQVAAGGSPAVAAAANGIQRQELTDEDRRRLAAAPPCTSGNCHEPVRSSAFGAGLGSSGSGLAPFGSPADTAVLRQWIEAQDQSPQQDEPATTSAEPEPKPLPVMAPPADRQAPPGIARLGSQRKAIHVAEVFAPETRFSSPFGTFGTRMQSQADVVAQYNVEINQPDPTAGYNFDTYLWNISTGQRIPAQYLGGTRFRVFMGTPECPGCHFGRGLEVDLHGQPFLTVMAEGLMAAGAISDMAAMAGSLGRRPPFLPGASTAAAEADEAALAAARTPDDEYNDFMKMLQEEGSTEFNAAGEPISMQPHGGASEARQTLGVTGEQQSMHGLPRSVGRHLPGYDPEAALTTFGERTMHTELDQPWKDAFQNMRRQGRTTASAQEVYDAVADSIQRSTQLSPGMKETLMLRLQDEMFVEYGLQAGQQMTLPYRNIRPR